MGNTFPLSGEVWLRWKEYSVGLPASFLNDGSDPNACGYPHGKRPTRGMVKAEWFKRYGANERPERFEHIVQSWDTAKKATELSDFSVCLRAPPGIGSMRTFSGCNLTVNEDGTVEMSADDAKT